MQKGAPDGVSDIFTIQRPFKKYAEWHALKSHDLKLTCEKSSVLRPEKAEDFLAVLTGIDRIVLVNDRAVLSYDKGPSSN